MHVEVQDGMGPYSTEQRSFTEMLQEHLDLLLAGKYEVFPWGMEVDRWARLGAAADRCGAGRIRRVFGVGVVR
jgi:hypothetical protein